MKRGHRTQGFTIIETLIFLAVSSALLVAAIGLFSGRQREAEFHQAMNDVQSQIQDLINNVASGYYARTSTTNFTCSAGGPGGGPAFSAGGPSTDRGTNQDCIFLGRAIQFGEAGSGGQNYNIFNLAGVRQHIGSGGILREAENYNETQPRAISPGSPPFNTTPDTTERNQLEYGVNVTKMYYTDSSGNHPTGIVGFTTSFANYKTALGVDQIQSGSQTVDIFAVNGSAINVQSAVQAVDSLDATPSLVTNPSGGVVVCLASAGTDQYGVLTIGGNGRQAALKVDILPTSEATKPGGVCA